MKSLAFIFSAFCLSGLVLTSCDTIDNPYPVSEPRPSLTATQALDSAEAAHDSIHGGPVTPVQKVLLEDYTGHQCGNCPSAAVKARELKTAFGEKLVVMAVHAGFFAKTLPNDTIVNPSRKFIDNFTTPTSEEWNTSFGVMAYPAGMINRAPKSGSTNKVQGIATWNASIGEQLAKTPKVGLTVTTLYNEVTRQVDVKVRSKYLADMSGKYNLMVVLSEDGIINWQKNYGATAGGDPAYTVGDIKNYVHPHAMRKALTSTWGKLNKDLPKTNDVTQEYFTTTLDNAWKAEKCSIVAFIFDEATREIIQVEEVHLEE